MKTTVNVEQFRSENYNAVVESIRHLHADLAIMRVRPRNGPVAWQAGQYTVLGLGNFEVRNDGVPVASEQESPRLIRRAYSISSPLLDESGELSDATQSELLEFYIARVTRPSDLPPMLTPRLFALQPGAAIHVGERAHGTYDCSGLDPHTDVVLMGTGTGEAPHNAMVASLLKRGHRGQIICCACVRFARDLAYLDAHRRLETLFANYHYVALTTRESVNLNPDQPGFVGRRYLQDLWRSGELKQFATLDPGATHVFLCGNPRMIGLPQRPAKGPEVFPTPAGMVELLLADGFQLDHPRGVGNVHFEKYW